MSKNSSLVEKGKARAEEIISNEQEAVQQRKDEATANRVLGAIIATNRIGAALNSQAMRAMQQFFDEGMHERLGYKSVVDFLNSPDAPLTKAQYYERTNALELEGDQTFDVLNNLRIPISTRKQLRAGDFQIEGDDIVLGDGEKRIPISDRVAVVEAIKGLTDKTAEQSRTIERGKKDVEKWKRKADEAKKNGRTEATPYDQALNDCIAGLVKLSAEASELTNDERRTRSDEMLRTVGPAYSKLMRSYQLEDDGELSDDRIADLMED